MLVDIGLRTLGPRRFHDRPLLDGEDHRRHERQAQGRTAQAPRDGKGLQGRRLRRL
ncbi:MAG: hypothetical protein MZU97_07040 [Bacillus subtilis]|nr:hypothetical protein [Bacillus subtilis]